MKGKRFSEKKSRRNGFYLALAVCLVAVGIAAWSTYDAVHSYVKPQGESSALTQQKNEDVRKSQVTSSNDPEDPEAPKVTAAPAPAKQTAGSVASREETAKPEESVASTAPAQMPKENAASEPDEEEQVPVNAPLYEISEDMMYPVEQQEIAKAYSAGAPVYSETMKDWRVHVGTDMTAKPGEDVFACANGQVKRTYTDSMLGNVIIIEHGDYEFSYCGLGENFLVAEGDIVTKGQAIGNVTAVPGESADETHLHLEVRRDGVCLNPENVINGQD